MTRWRCATKIGLCRGPHWSDADAHAASRPVLEAGRRLERRRRRSVTELTLTRAVRRPDRDARRAIMYGEGAPAFLPAEAISAHACRLLHPEFRGLVENSREITIVRRCQQAYGLAAACRPAFDGLFGLGWTPC